MDSQWFVESNDTCPSTSDHSTSSFEQVLNALENPIEILSVTKGCKTKFQTPQLTISNFTNLLQDQRNTFLSETLRVMRDVEIFILRCACLGSCFMFKEAKFDWSQFCKQLINHIQSLFSKWKCVTQEYESFLEALCKTLSCRVRKQKSECNHKSDSTRKSECNHKSKCNHKSDSLIVSAKQKRIREILNNFTDIYNYAARAFKSALELTNGISKVAKSAVENYSLHHGFRHLHSFDVSLRRIKSYQPDLHLVQATSRDEFLDVYEEWKREMSSYIASSFGWSINKKSSLSGTRNSLNSTNDIENSNDIYIVMSHIVRDYTIDLTTPVPDYIENRAILLMSQLDDATIESLSKLFLWPYHAGLEKYLRADWTLHNIKKLASYDNGALNPSTPYYKDIRNRKPPLAISRLKSEFANNRAVLHVIYRDHCRQASGCEDTVHSLDFRGHFVLLGMFYAHLLYPIMQFTFKTRSASNTLKWSSSTFANTGVNIKIKNLTNHKHLFLSEILYLTKSMPQHNFGAAANTTIDDQNDQNTKEQAPRIDHIYRLASELRHQSRTKRFSLPFPLEQISIPPRDFSIHKTTIGNELAQQLAKTDRALLTLQASNVNATTIKKSFLSGLSSRLLALETTCA